MGWVEWARALGACGVVLLHVLTSTSLAADLSFVRLQAYTVASIVLGRWAVPAFFMITGLLLLDPSKEVGWDRARAYAGRMVLVLVTFGFAFALMEEAWVALQDGEGLSVALVPRAAVDVLRADTWDHLWYVYALVVVYLLVPILKTLCARLGKKGFLVFSLALFVGVLVVPTLLRMGMVLVGTEPVVPQKGLFAFVSNVAVGITCFCLGGCVRSWKLRRVVVVAGCASLATMLGVSLWGLAAGLGDLGFVFLQASCFSCLYALLVLMCLRRWLGTAPVRAGTLTDALAHDSFGIYMLHPVFVHLVLIALDPLAFPAGLFELVFYVVVLGASVVATRLLRHVPWLGGLL